MSPGLNSLPEVRTIMESLTETMQAQTADEDRVIRSNTPTQMDLPRRSFSSTSKTSAQLMTSPQVQLPGLC